MKALRSRERETVFCVAAAAIALLLCSMNSPLYPLNPWDDVNCFMTVARETLRGSLPYRDLIEQKGPLLYALHALALWMWPESYHGVWLAEIAALTGVLICFHRIARLYRPEISVGWAAAAAAVICMCRSFRYGDSAEEFCLLPMAWSLYMLLRSWRTGVSLSDRQYLLNGVLAGCILWIKFNLLGFHLAWMGFQAIDVLIHEKSMKHPVRMCLCFLAGMLLTGVPWLLWYGMNGALEDLFRVYFGVNLFSYGPRRHNMLVYTAAGLLRGMQDWRLSVPLMTACAALAFAPREAVSKRERLFVVCAALAMALGIYGMGNRFRYYYLPFALLLPFCVLLPCRSVKAGRFLSEWRKRPAGNAVLCTLLLTVSMACAWMLSGNTRWIGYPYEKTAQGQAAALTGSAEDAMMLNVDALDAGFYFATGARPAIPDFVKLNARQEQCMEAQRKCLGEGGADYAVTVDETLSGLGIDSGYELMAELPSEYGGETKIFRLYRKTDE